MCCTVLLKSFGSYFILYYFIQIILCCHVGQYENDGKCLECKDLFDNGTYDSFMENCWSGYTMIVKNIKNSTVHMHKTDLNSTTKCFNSNDCENLLEMCNFSPQLCEPCNMPKTDNFRRWSQCYSKALLFLKNNKPENLNVTETQASNNVLIGILVGGILFLIVFGIITWLVYQKYVVKRNKHIKTPEMERLPVSPIPMPPAASDTRMPNHNINSPVRMVFNPETERLEHEYHIYEIPSTKPDLKEKQVAPETSNSSTVQKDATNLSTHQNPVTNHLQGQTLAKDTKNEELSTIEKLNAVFAENEYINLDLYVANWTKHGILSLKEKQLIMDNRNVITDDQKQEKLIQILSVKDQQTLQKLARFADELKHKDFASSLRFYFGG